ncbi:MAG TPA: polyphenol oxidase family protein [Thermoanaerobaculia bacterium]|jgi:YfiH family protein|nr:polyphenol oxidase family protein [Thermoanaerobaculia bacterium]
MWSIQSTTTIGRVVVPPFVPAGFRVFCTTRDFDGFLSHERAELLSRAIDFETRLATCTQVHGATVHRVTHEGAWRECDSCDALWSDESATALAIKIADCLPIAMIDPIHGVMANVHSGWRGAVQRITAAAIDAASLDTTSSYAYLGPSIRVCCFEVGEEVAEQFDARYIDRSYAKPHVDLVAFTTDILRERGFANISDSEMCTRCEGSIFHSFRRDGKGGGRNLQIAARA